MKKFIFTLTLLIAFTVSTIADVIPLPIDQSGGYEISKDNLIGKEEYLDESIHVSVERSVFKRANCMCVRIKVSDPSQIRTAMTRDSYDVKEYIATKTLAKKKNSVLAINGDFFKYNDYGYLVRQGVLYRDRADEVHDILLIDDLGNFTVVQKPTNDKVHSTVSKLEKDGRKVINSFNFGPTLVIDGNPLEDIDTSIYQGRYKMMRLAIGQLAPLEYAIYFCYGTSDAQEGLSLPNFAEYIAEVTPGVKVAFNLDGGGSTHVVLLGKQLHKNPSGRDISDIIYFCSASDSLGSERAE